MLAASVLAGCSAFWPVNCIFLHKKNEDTLHRWVALLLLIFIHFANFHDLGNRWSIKCSHVWRQFLILNFDLHQKILNNLRLDYVAVINQEYIKSEKLWGNNSLISKIPPCCHEDKLVPVHFHISRALKSRLLSRLINWLVIYPVPRGKWFIKTMLIHGHSPVNSPPCPGGREAGVSID
jgi:hypothetical protein